MIKPLRLLAIGSLLAACASGGGGTVDATPAQPTGEVVVPTGMKVSAAISSATLGDEGCAPAAAAGAPASGQRPAASCAPIDAGAAADGSSGGFAADESNRGDACGGGLACRPSTVQIQFTAGAGSAPARVEIDEVLLVDATSQATLTTITASSPQSWDDATSKYRSWDESLAPASTLKTSYTLSSIAWSKLGTTSTSRSSASYRIVVSLRVGGVAMKLLSSPIQREPEVAT